jgi:tellurite resistance protein TerC
MSAEFWAWPALIGLIVVMLAVDMLVIHREAKVISFNEALVWSIVWTVIGVGFAAVIFAWKGNTAGGEYLAGYVIERSLSVDNIFVFALLFSYFAVPSEYQHRVLIWGVVGAIFFRIVFIAVGSTLLESFHWMIYVFGGFLVFTGFRMLRHKDVDVHPENNPALRFLRRIVPMTPDYQGTRFLVRYRGALMATPLLAVLVSIETTDIVFAVDSIPAIFAVTDDAFIVFSSNAFAILGMRVLYFLLADLIHRFVYLSVGLAAVLILVGVKMMTEELYHFPIFISLLVIAAILAVAIVWSLLATRSRTAVTAGHSIRPADHDGRRGSETETRAGR